MTFDSAKISFRSNEADISTTIVDKNNSDAFYIGYVKSTKEYHVNFKENNIWSGEQKLITNSDLPNIQFGIIEIAANSASVTIQFEEVYKQDPIVVATGKFIYKKNIICSLASVGKSSFDLYPIDTSTNNPPTDKSVFNWIAIGI